jgi:hypothetical protein
MKKTYTAGTNYYTEEERAVIKGVLQGNEELYRILRKSFIPTIDENTPGALIDVYAPIPFADLSAEDAKINGVARNMLINHLNLVLTGLWSLANAEPKTKEEMEQAKLKDSNK